MSIKKIKREREKVILKQRIDELLMMLSISKSSWKKLKVRVEGVGLSAKIPQKYFKATDKVPWGRHQKGHKPSLKSQYSILFDFWQERMKNEELFEKIKKQLDEQKESENERR